MFHLVGGHVVEQDCFGAVLEGVFEFLLSADFDLDTLAGFAAGEGAAEDGADAAAEGDVVVLDEDAVGEVEAMVGAAAAEDGVLVEGAEAGDGLAGVEYVGLGAGEFVGVAGGSGWRCRSCAA